MLEVAYIILHKVTCMAITAVMSIAAFGNSFETTFWTHFPIFSDQCSIPTACCPSHQSSWGASGTSESGIHRLKLWHSLWTVWGLCGICSVQLCLRLWWQGGEDRNCWSACWASQDFATNAGQAGRVCAQHLMTWVGSGYQSPTQFSLFLALDSSYCIHVIFISTCQVFFWEFNLTGMPLLTLVGFGHCVQISLIRFSPSKMPSRFCTLFSSFGPFLCFWVPLLSHLFWLMTLLRSFVRSGSTYKPILILCVIS